MQLSGVWASSSCSLLYSTLDGSIYKTDDDGCGSPYEMEIKTYFLSAGDCGKVVRTCFNFPLPIIL